MKTSLSSRGYSILKEDLSSQQITKIKKDLTVVPYVPPDFNMVKPNPFPLFMESTNKIYVPKVYGLENYGVPLKNKLSSACKSIDVIFKGVLRPEQEEPAKKVIDACLDPKQKGGILNLYCGGGKTTISLYVASILKKKTIIVVHKDFLLNQWKERIEQFIPDARIGMIKAKVVDIMNKDFVLASLQSLCMKDYEDNLFNDFGLAIVDEVHHTSAEVFSQALKKINCEFSIGLSATVKRKDGLSKVFMWFLGSIVYKASKRVDTVSVLYKEYYVPDPLYSKEYHLFGDKLNIAKMINNICNYFPRIEFMTDTIRCILEKEPMRKVLILSDRRNHLQTMYDYFARIGLDAGLYIGGMKQDVLAACEKRQIILATFAIASEGYDQKGLDTLVLASPKSDVVQSVGRILRDKENDRKHVPMVIDIVDRFSIFERQALKRLKYYQANKYHVVRDDKFTNEKLVLQGKCYFT